MGMKRRWKSWGGIQAEWYIFAIVFAVQIAGIFFRSVPIITDELNPMAFGFLLRGDDWGNYLAADGYYYKYGQLLFYLPLILFIKNPVVLFRGMLVVNSFIISLIPVCAYRIMKKYLKCGEEENCREVAILVGILPAVSLNSKLVWGEPFLMVIPWLILLLVLVSLEEGAERAKKQAGRRRKHRGLGCSIALAVLQSYAYMVHNRGIVILIATVCCVLGIRFLWKSRHIKLIPYFSTMAVLLLADKLLSVLLKGSLYQTEGDLTGGTAGFLNIDFFRHVLSPKGIWTLVQEMMGWLFASVSGSYGLVAFGLAVSCLVLYALIRRKEYSKPETVVGIFGLLCFCGALLLGAFFFFEDIFSAGHIIEKRGDKLIYVRYLDAANVVLSFLGLYYLLAKKQYNKGKYLFYPVGLFLILQGFYVSVISERIDNTLTWGSNVIIISYFCDLTRSIRGSLYSRIGFFAGGIALFGLFSFAVFCLMLYLREKGKAAIYLCAAVFLSGYLWNAYHTLYRMDSYVSDMAYAYCDVIRSVETAEKVKNIYLADEIVRSSFQYVYHDYYVITKRDNLGKQEENMFILAEKGEVGNLGLEGALYEVVLGEKVGGVRLYIKGERLNELVKENGYETREV